MNRPVGKLTHNRFSIVKLLVTDEAGTIIQEPYPLTDGANVFRALAVYSDGTSEPYNAVWACPIVLRGGNIDYYGVLGQQPRAEVSINASPSHQRYTGLECWAWPPSEQTPTGNAEIPHHSFSFDYTNIE